MQLGKIQRARTGATEVLLLALISNSPDHGGTVAKGRIPRDEEDPCWAPCVTSSLRAERMGWSRAAMPTGIGPKGDSFASVFYLHLGLSGVATLLPLRRSDLASKG